MGTKLVLRRVGVFSSLKIGCVLGGVLFAIIGCFVLLLPGLLGGGGAFIAALSEETGVDPGTLGAGIGVLGFIVIAYVVGVLVYSVMTGLVMALYALLYNIVARMAGGLEIELEEGREF